MNFNYIYNKNILNLNKYACLSLKSHKAKNIWLINSIEGTQSQCVSSRIRINNICGIIITTLNINQISGLIGLLSTLSLMRRNKSLYIYSAPNLSKYLKLVKQYIKTNFKYKIYIHTLKTGNITKIKDNIIYFFRQRNLYSNLIIYSYEQHHKFQLKRAINLQIFPGPVYGNLKKCNNIILPDGIILNGNQFINMHYIGHKLTLISTAYHNRSSYEISWNSNFCYSGNTYIY